MYSHSIYDKLAASHPDWDRDHDVRIGYFSGVHRALSNARINLNMYSAFMIPEFTEPNKNDYVTFGDHEPRQYKVLLEYESYIWRAYFETVFHGTETAFRLLLRHLAPGVCKDGRGAFASIYRSLLRTQLTECPRDAIELLDLLRHSRNTLHNDGMFRDTEDKTVNYKGRPFTFVRDTFVGFTWEMALVLTKDLIDLFYSVVQDPAVASRAAAIPEPGWDLVRPEETDRMVQVKTLTHSQEDVEVCNELYKLGLTESRSRDLRESVRDK